MKISNITPLLGIQSNVSHSVNRKNILYHLNPSTTAIIPYGFYQSSGFGFGVALPRKVYSMYVLTPFLHSVILGLLLGDGWLEKSLAKRNVNARFGLKQSIINLKFILFVFNLLSPFCGSMPALTKSTRQNGVTDYGVAFKTRNFPFLTEYYAKFYVNGVKLIPTDLIINLDGIALAFWIMSDGSYEKGGLVLCTDSFTLNDVCLLIGILHYKFGLDCTLRSTKNNMYYRIYIKQKSMQKVRELVTPFTHPHFLYKLKSDE